MSGEVVLAREGSGSRENELPTYPAESNDRDSNEESSPPGSGDRAENKESSPSSVIPPATLTHTWEGTIAAWLSSRARPSFPTDATSWSPPPRIYEALRGLWRRVGASPASLLEAEAAAATAAPPPPAVLLLLDAVLGETRWVGALRVEACARLGDAGGALVDVLASTLAFKGAWQRGTARLRGGWAKPSLRVASRGRAL